MKIIGLVGRAYYNKDDQEIIQFNEYIRKCFSSYDDVMVIGILPSGGDVYVSAGMGNDVISDVDRVKLDSVLQMCDGFVIPGGSYWYNFDEYVIRYAIMNNKSVLAICLGFQCLCSMYALDRNKFDMTDRFGDDSHYDKDAFGYVHKVLVRESKLRNILGKNEIFVNSIHRDYVDFSLRDELVISSLSSDGVVESVELLGCDFVIGLQWHPEYLMDLDSVKIFDAFVLSLDK